MTLTPAIIAPAVAGLLLLAAILSACETALTAASRTRLHEFERRGSRRAYAALKLTERREAVAGGLLLWKLVAILAATALLVSYGAAAAGVPGMAYATLAVIAAVLVLVELLPKALALSHADGLAMLVAPVLRPLLAPAGALVLALESLVRKITRLAGASISPAQDILTAHQELRGAIDQHHTEGSVVKTDRDMLGGILDLSELEVSDVMIHRTKMLSFDVATPVDRMLADILKSGHSRVPIWKENPENIIGILNIKNLFAGIHGNEGNAARVNVSEILSPPWFVPDTRALSDQLNAFLRRRSHFAIVVDEYGEMMGIITLEDIIEEIVGEISDEHDSVAAGIRQQPDGSFIIDGTVPVRDINRLLDWKLPDDEATTIAGLVIHEARMIPVTGQVFTFHGFRFEVLRKRRHQVVALRVTALSRDAVF